MADPWAVTRVRADDRVLQHPLVYHGALLVADGVGFATVDIYDGTDANGERRDALRAQTSEHDQHLYDAGLMFNNGLFVDFGANVSVVLVYWRPVERLGQ